MNATEQSKLLNRTAEYSPITGLVVQVRIVDIRQVFGRTDAQITPLKGSGRAWVNLTALKLDKA